MPESACLFSCLHRVLPLFSVALPGGGHVLYTPGRLSRIDNRGQKYLRQAWSGGDSARGDPALDRLALLFEHQARETMRRWRERAKASFQPLCLTVYLNNRCNSHCVYCYAALTRDREPLPRGIESRISPGAVIAAARRVAAVCRKTGNPFTLVLHGGGEPTLDFDLIQHLVRETRKLAHDAGCGWHGHLATNGVMPESRAVWLAHNFDSIGLSHDGPGTLHDRQRPLANGAPSLSIVERTFRALQQGRAHVCLRTTVTPAGLTRQTEIVDYFARTLGAKEIRLEPVYRVRGRGPLAFDATMAKSFVGHFLAAQAHGRRLGAEVSFSGFRPEAFLGPYCDDLRNSLHIVPGEVATACFFTTGETDAMAAGGVVGRWEPATGEFILDETRLAAHGRQALRIPSACRRCVAIYHCTHGCPDYCVAAGHGRRTMSAFRCGIIREFMVRWILAAAPAPSRKENTGRMNSPADVPPPPLDGCAGA